MDGLERYLDIFREYVSHYDLNNEKIKRKYEHSIRVMNLSNKYATLLEFSKEDIELATLIGLLHDIGRFEQLKVYDTFIDSKSIDHADYSVEQLFSNGEIKKFTDKEEWYPIIEFAIKNHNKLDIPFIKDDRMLKHAKLIRDVDKVDIMFTMIGKCKQDDSRVSKEVIDAIKRHGLIDRKYVKTRSDLIVNQYGFVFNIYYDIVLKEYKENFIKFHEEIKDKEKFKFAYDEVIKYIDERILKYERNRNKV